MNNADGFRGWDLFLSSGKPTVHVIDQWTEKALKVTAKEALKPGRWHHVMAVFDGTLKGADAIAIFVNGRKVEVEINSNNLGPNIVSDVPLRLGGRSNNGKAAELITGGKVFIQDLRMYEKALTPLQVAQVAITGLVREYQGNIAGSDASHASPLRTLSEYLAQLVSRSASISLR